MSNCTVSDGQTVLNSNGDNLQVNSTKTDDNDDDEANWELCSAYDHDKKFDPEQYLDGFYKTASEDTAMRIVLFFLPGLVYYLPEKIHTILDLGAGPTVYVPIVFRNRATNIYTSDYAEVNQKTLQFWYLNQNRFQWSEVCQWIANIEFSKQHPVEMQNTAREKLRAILKVNVHQSEVIQGVHCYCNCNPGDPVPKQFQVVVTIFCLEYACETLDEYRNAVKNAVKLIEPNGYLVQGGVLNAKEYSFGGKRFRCHTLTKPQLLQTLQEFGMTTTRGRDFKLIIYDDVFVLFSKKR